MTKKIPIEKQAFDILNNYKGNNNFIKNLKYRIKNNLTTMSKGNATYVVEFHDKPVYGFKKWVKIDDYFGEELQKKYILPQKPTQIYIHKILAQREKAVHIWGKVFESQELVDLWVPKVSIIKEQKLNKVELSKIDWSKYNRKPMSHQFVGIRSLLEHDKFILADDMGLGKCEFVDNKVFTPLGRKRIGDIKVGDYVIGSNGKPTLVEGVFPQGKKELYRVTFNDDYSVLVGGEHLWSVTSSNGSKNNKNREIRYTVLTTNQMLDKDLSLEQIGTGWNKKRPYKFKTYYKLSNGNNKWQIPIVKPIEFGRNQFECLCGDGLPINPYLLGVSLGGGYINKVGNIKIELHKDDFDEIFNNQILNEGKQQQNKRVNNINTLKEEIKSLKLNGTLSHTKFIPDIYKYSSIDDRLALLQGLMDTDGYCMKAKNSEFAATEYCTVSEQLADDVAEVVHSLGGIVRKHSKIGSYKKPDGTKIICKRVFRLNIKLPSNLNPFRLKRKADLYKSLQKYKVGRHIKNIEFEKEDEAVCIQVSSPDHLYVTEHGIVTHNTYQTIVSAIESGSKKILVVCPASLKLNWKKEIEICGENPDDIAIISGKNWVSGHKWTIINYDILKNFHTVPDRRKKDQLLNISILDEKFDLIIGDECFTYDTLVSTMNGDMKIGDIVENNLNIPILSYNLNENKLEYKNINRWIKKETNNSLLKINLPNGIFIECTPNHKIYVKNKGCVRADEITTNDELFTLSETINKKTNMEKKQILLQKLCIKRCKQSTRNERKNVINTYKTEEKHNLSILRKNIFSTSLQQKTFLWKELFCKMENVTTGNKGKSLYKRNKGQNVNKINLSTQKKPRLGETSVNSHERKQSYVKPKKYRKNEGEISGENLSFTRWKWKNNGTTKESLQRINQNRQSLDFRITNKNENSNKRFRIFTSILFSGYWPSNTKTSNRDRWKYSQNKKMEIFRQEKDTSIKCVRVESIEILEQGSGSGIGQSNEKNTTVYNLEISDNHNYFSNNILVSNCHFLKNKTAGRTKLFNDFAEKTKKLWLLTGTPITNRPIDYYNLLHLCESRLASSWIGFVKRYCDGKQFYGKGGRRIWDTKGATNLQELRENTTDVILRRRKEEVLDLPEKIIQPIYQELVNKKEYEKIVGEYNDWLEHKKEVTLALQLTKLVELRQFLALEKLKSTIELAESAIDEGKKVIIFTNFTKPLLDLQEHFGKSCVIHHGKMSKLEKEKSVEEFQNNDKIKVFIGNIISAGVGITLTEGELVIFNDLSWLPSDHLQSQDRAHRIGQKKIVNVYYNIIDETLDLHLFEGLMRKMKVIDDVMGDSSVDENLFKSVIQKLRK